MGGHSLNPLIVLGVTGSIGGQTLEVADRLDVAVHAIAARRASDELLEIALERRESIVCVTDPGDQREQFLSKLGSRIRFGPGAISEISATPGCTVVNGIVGAAGLPSSLAALYAGNRLALANKESLVAGGPLIAEALASGEGELIPVDSEHAAIYQCLIGEPAGTVARVILTASGGPFRGFSSEDLESVTLPQALNHPTWSMGQRITIDSATLMNKAFEVIEAHYLFKMGFDDIAVLVHPESVVHSFVEFRDGVVKAEIGAPDMKKPIQYAITAPERAEVRHQPFTLTGRTLTFEEPDPAVFPCLRLGYEAGRIGGTATAVLNAADEVTVAAFLNGQIGFAAIAEVVESVLNRHQSVAPRDIGDVEAADSEARVHAREEVDART